MNSPYKKKIIYKKPFDLHSLPIQNSIWMILSKEATDATNLNMSQNNIQYWDILK